MKVGILGTGGVGEALGTGFTTLGHDVKMGSRDAANPKLKAWVAKAGARASGGTFAEAAAFGEVVVLCTLFAGAENAIQLAGAPNFSGKVVIDTTNPLDFSVSPPRMSVGLTDSAGECVQRWLPGAKVVKAFNIVGSLHMFQPDFPGGPPDMFYCGNDEAAKKTVAGILKDFGWPAIDLGPIEGSRFLEPMAMVWIMHGFRTNGWNHALKLLRK